MLRKFLGRFKQNISVKKLESNQPVRIWSFVIILNIVGIIGFLIINNYNIGPGM